MEEVDSIIIHSLKSIGCDIEDDILSLRQFPTYAIVEATVRCLRLINNATDLPHTLPGGMSAKFRLGTALATALTDIGYTGDIGYQTFLYSNEADIRKVFMFLIEKIPKASTETTEETLGSSVLLQRAISAELAKRLQSPWIPSHLKKDGITWRGRPPSWQREGVSSMHKFHACSLSWPQGVGDLTQNIPKELKYYYKAHLPYVTNQPPNHDDIAPSILEENLSVVTSTQEWDSEWNSAGLASRLTEEEYRNRKRQRILKRVSDQLQRGVREAEQSGATLATQDLSQLLSNMTGRAAASSGKTKGSRFTHTEKLQYAQDEDKMAAQLAASTVDGPRVDTEEELQQKREEEVSSFRDELAELTSRFENMDADMKQFTAKISAMNERISGQDEANAEKKDTFSVKKRTLDLLPDAENNISKLQSVVDGSAQRLVSLANQWEQHRAPLIKQYRDLKELNSRKVSEAELKLEEIKAFREKMKEVAEDTRSKDDLYKKLVSEYERMSKDVNRSAYTRKIMEIVANIKKQNLEIDKVLIDTRSVQKEINQLQGKLDRTFTVADELIFRDAKKDESVRKAYKCLAALQENCDLLIHTVEETGVIMREIRDLEDQIEQEGSKKVQTNMEKISADFTQMKKENAALMAKLKSKS